VKKIRKYVIKIACMMIIIACAREVLWAQLNLLTKSEALSIVERISDVATAMKNRGCPNLSVEYFGNDIIDIQVRCECGSESGMLVGNYRVNRKTGKVTYGGDRKSALDKQGEAYSKEIVSNAQKRILSVNEAKCIAVEAAKAIPGWDEKDAVISAKQIGDLDKTEKSMAFNVAQVYSRRPVEIRRMLTVYLTDARVRDDETGIEISSSAVGNYVSKLLELRFPGRLNESEAALIALSIPQVTEKLGNDCKLYMGGTYQYGKMLAGVACKNATINKIDIIVNLQTGVVTNPESGKSLSTPQSERIARQILDQIGAHRAKLQKEIELSLAKCR
jgi:hypothetical protein